MDGVSPRSRNNNALLPEPRAQYDRWSPLNARQEATIRIRTLMILIALAAFALAAWIFIPPWWQYHQSIKTLTG